VQVLRDAVSIRFAPVSLPALAPFISRRLEELAEYAEYELSELINIVVVDAGDTLREVEAALGLETETRLPDAINTYPGWLELAYVLRDDGFGVVVYVPDTPLRDDALGRLRDHARLAVISRDPPLG